MAQRTVTVPESLASALGDDIDLPRWTLEAIVVEAVRDGLVSRGLGGEILGLGFHEREEFYARRGVVYDYTEEEFDAEGRDLERMLGDR